MKIRKEQVEAFNDSQTEAFVQRTVARLQRDFPDDLRRHGVRPAQVKPFVRDGMAKARSYGIVYEKDVAKYVECMVLLNPAFDDDPAYPWAKETLNADGLDGEVKMDLIDEHMLFSLEEPR